MFRNTFYSEDVFWGVAGWNLVDSYRRFGGICYLLLQGKRSSSSLNMETARSFKTLIPIKNLEHLTSHKYIFIETAVRIWNTTASALCVLLQNYDDLRFTGLAIGDFTYWCICCFLVQVWLLESDTYQWTWVWSSHMSCGVPPVRRLVSQPWGCSPSPWLDQWETEQFHPNRRLLYRPWTRSVRSLSGSKGRKH